MKKLFALLLSALIIFSMAACSSGGAETLEDAVGVYAQILACDISEDDFKNICPDSMWEYTEEHIGKTFDEVYTNIQIEMIDQREVTAAVFGSDFAVSYEILSKTNTSAEKLNDLKKNLSENFGISADTIGTCYDVNVLFKISGSLNQQEQEISVCVLQIDGTWYLADLLTEFL